MGLAVATVISLAFTATLAVTPAVRRVAWKVDAVSRPDGKRRQHARPTAVWGGVAVFIGLCLGVAATCFLLPTISDISGAAHLATALCISGGMLCLLGCYDDVIEMRAGLKLLGQTVSVLPIILAGCSASQLSFLGWEMNLGWLGIPFTLAWLIIGINALNLIDGMDGLASLLGSVIALAVAAIAFSLGLPDVMLIALALCGALAGFMVYNRPPAQVYLGDSGSMLIGLVLATLALRAGPVPGATSATVLAALLFVPLLDTGLAVIRRTLSGNGIMSADRGHVHHRLQDRGLSIWGTLGVLGALCLVSGVVAWGVAAGWYQEVIAWGTLGGVTILCVNRRLLGHEEWGLAKDRWTRIVAPGSASLTAERIPHGAPCAESASTPGSLVPHGRTEREIAEGRPLVAKRIRVRVELPVEQSVRAAPAGERQVELVK